MDVRWHWPKFIMAIETNGELQRVTHSAMRRLNLSWRVDAWESERACDLFLIASTPRDDALAEGIHLAGRAAEVYAALLPLYDAGTGRACFG